MTVFYVIEKQKSRFCLQFFLLKSSLQTQKSTFTAKFSPSPSLEVILFALICCWGRVTASHSSAYQPCLYFQHHHCIACWEIARILGSVCSFPHIFHIYTKSTATPTYHRNFALQWSQIPKYAVVGQEIYQQSSPKATSFWSGHFYSSTNNEPNSQTK